jgi:hypothetical protein
MCRQGRKETREKKTENRKPKKFAMTQFLYQQSESFRTAKTTMSIVCIALIGKQNEPLYFYCKEDSSEFIHLQMIAHSALDVIEEKKKKYFPLI